MSNSIDNMIYAFKDLHCYDFLVKPTESDLIKSLGPWIKIQNFKNKSTPSRKSVYFDTKSCIFKIFLDEVIFIEILNRVCIIHTLDKRYEVPYLTLKKVMEKIDEPNIIQSHRAFLINTHYIKNIDKDSKTWKVIFENYKDKALIGLKFRSSLLENLKLSEK